MSDLNIVVITHLEER